MSLEDDLRVWANPPSKTEIEKCENAERIVYKAIAADPTLSTLNLRIFVQGSYKNQTNVRIESDVDIAVLYRGSFFYDLPEGEQTPQTYGIIPATYEYSEFKKDVDNALNAYFEADDITRGNKAFDLHANSYRVDADVVPVFEYKRYFIDAPPRIGTAFVPDNCNRKVYNYPEQNYVNGMQKNTDTFGRFKDLVRILKRMKYKLIERDIISEEDSVASFLIESAVWNVPNVNFAHPTYYSDVRSVLAYLFNNTIDVFNSNCSDWREVNNFKYLFHITQPWTSTDLHNFVSAVWDEWGFE